MAVSDWSTTPSSNTNCDGTNIGENCPPGNLNDAIRKVMAAVRVALSDFWLGLLSTTDAAGVRSAISAAQATNATNSIAGLTPAADKLPYFTGAASAGLTTLSSFIRTLLDDPDAATARATIGAASTADTLGFGQTWQNVFSSRSSGTSYQNTTGKPIQVYVWFDGVSNYFQVSADGVSWPVSFGNGDLYYKGSVIVPNGHYYRVSGGGSIYGWNELR